MRPPSRQNVYARQSVQDRPLQLRWEQPLQSENRADVRDGLQLSVNEMRMDGGGGSSQDVNRNVMRNRRNFGVCEIMARIDKMYLSYCVTASQ